MKLLSEDMNRREFLRLAGVAVGGVSLAGCTTGGGPEPTGTSGGLKTIRFAMSGAISTADTADPHLNTSQHDGRLNSAVYEQLAAYDDSLKAVPQLAESWEPNEAGDVWTFTLRPDVTFHDGSRLTAGDVIYSFQRILDPATASPGAASLAFLDPDGLKAVGDGRVRFRLSEPIADLPVALINRQAYIVQEGANSGDLRAAATGTGPFKLDQFTPGEGPTVFGRNKKYWRSGFPKADVIELRSIAEPAARVAALMRGQIDVIEDPPGTEIEGLKAGPDTALVIQPKGNMEVIAMQIDVPPFDDVRVRKAFKYAMNRETMLQLVAQGQGTLVNDIPISSILEFALPERTREHDVAKAKALLQEAGHGSGLDVTLAVSEVQDRFIEIATTYKELAADAGINLELDIKPADTYWDEVWLQVPMFVSAWIARPVDSMLALLFLAKADWNETHWQSDEWDRKFARARSTLDYAERGALYQQLQAQIVEEGGYLVPYMVNTIGAMRTTVTGWKPSGTPFENFATIDITS